MDLVLQIAENNVKIRMRYIICSQNRQIVNRGELKKF